MAHGWSPALFGLGEEVGKEGDGRIERPMANHSYWESTASKRLSIPPAWKCRRKALGTCADRRSVPGSGGAGRGAVGPGHRHFARKDKRHPGNYGVSSD